MQAEQKVLATPRGQAAVKARIVRSSQYLARQRGQYAAQAQARAAAAARAKAAAAALAQRIRAAQVLAQQRGARNVGVINRTHVVTQHNRISAVTARIQRARSYQQMRILR